MRPADAYDYLVEAREQLFERVGRLSQQQYTREFPFARHSIRATLVRIVDSEAWYRRIEHGSVEGRLYSHRLRTTAGGVVTQLLFHEVHHRAQVMMMLRALSVPLQSIDYNLLRWTWFKKKKG